MFPDGWTNTCSFCRSSWAEDDYSEFLANVERLKGMTKEHKDWYKAKFETHDSDCLWVRANELVRG